MLDEVLKILRDMSRAPQLLSASALGRMDARDLGEFIGETIRDTATENSIRVSGYALENPGTKNARAIITVVDPHDVNQVKGWAKDLRALLPFLRIVVQDMQGEKIA